MRTASLFGVFAILTSAATAQVVASDTFDYTGLLTDHCWVNHSGTGVFQMTDGARAVLSHGSGSREDANLGFAPFGATDTIYASFTLNVPSTSPVTAVDGQGLYFAHFFDSGFAFRARTGVLNPASAGDYVIAINSDNADLGVGASWATDLSYDTDYLIVIAYDAATGTSTLWVDPTLETDTSVSHTASAGTIIERFGLRQSSDYTGDMFVDDVQVGATFDDVLGQASRYCTFATSCDSSVGPAGNTASQFPEIDKDWVIEIAPVPAPEGGVIVIGTAMTPPLDLAFLGAFNCSAHITTDVLTSFSFGSSGAITFTIAIPNDPFLVGLDVFTQAVVFETGINPAGLITSAAAEATLGS